MKWTKKTATEMVKRNGGTVTQNQVRHSHPGIKVLGAIDYLVNHCKMTWFK